MDDAQVMTPYPEIDDHNLSSHFVPLNELLTLPVVVFITHKIAVGLFGLNNISDTEFFDKLCVASDVREKIE
ncbi:hypothetical protein [Polaromonas sp. YR568]|uniref:hypothetical protein n=1 Tax=Polaromonas sp. YR568 TaxID=1855301 RepID=UPI00398BF29A